MDTIKIDNAAAHTLARQAEMLESRLDHLLATWDEATRRLSPPQQKDVIESLRDGALEHRLFVYSILRHRLTQKY